MDEFDIDVDDMDFLSARAADIIGEVTDKLLAEQSDSGMPKAFGESAIFHGAICSSAAKMQEVGVAQEDAILMVITCVLNAYSDKRGMN